MRGWLLRGCGFLILGAHLLSAPGCFPTVHHYLSDTFWHWPDGDPQRQNVVRATEDFPEIGRSTREEVLLRLGDPDLRSRDESRFVYRWRMVVGVIGGCGSGSPIKRDYHLEIRFDKEGVVTSCEYL